MKINEILFPKSHNLIGKKKPLLVLLNSPFDQEDGSVKIKNAITVAQDRGFTVLNRAGHKALNFGDRSLDNKLKLVVNKKPGLTIWVESHGAPGWLFAGKKNAQEEMDATINFAEYIVFLERKLEININSVILNSCFSANEYLSTSSQVYFNSPARLLSMLLPERNIIGFIGLNTTAGVQAYKKLPKEDKYQPHTFSLEEAAANFKNGNLLEASKSEIYCDHHYTPDFIEKACGIDIDDYYYKPCFGKEEIDKRRKAGITFGKSYGDMQIIYIKNHLKKQDLTRPVTPPPFPPEELKCTP